MIDKEKLEELKTYLIDMNKTLEYVDPNVVLSYLDEIVKENSVQSLECENCKKLLKIDKEKIKEIALHFWECAIKYCSDMEFGSPSNAKDFDKCFNDYDVKENSVQSLECENCKKLLKIIQFIEDLRR